MNGYTLSKRNGSRDVLDNLNGRAAGSSNDNKTTNGQDKRAQREGPLGEGSMRTPKGAPSTPKARQIDGKPVNPISSDISPTSLFDEDHGPVEYASPPSKWPQMSEVEAKSRARSHSNPMRVASVEVPKVAISGAKALPPTEVRTEEVSVYSADAEGEDDSEVEAMVVPDPTVPETPPPDRSSHQKSSSISSLPLGPNEPLFTPSPKPSKPNKRKEVFQCVEILSLPKEMLKKYRELSAKPPPLEKASSSSKPRPVPPEPKRILTKPPPQSAPPRPVALKTKLTSQAGSQVHTSLADAFNHAMTANTGASTHIHEPVKTAKKPRKPKGNAAGPGPSSSAIHAVPPFDEEDIPLSLLAKKRKKTENVQDPPRKKPRPMADPSVPKPKPKPRKPPAKVMPLEPPPPKLYYQDEETEIVLLFEAPFEGTSEYDAWMNGRSLLLDKSLDRLDKDILQLTYNREPAPYPPAQFWTKESLRQIAADISDDEWSLGGHWFDDGDVDSDDGEQEEAFVPESEESFGGSPPRSPPATSGLIQTPPEIRVLPNGITRQYSSKHKRQTQAPSSPDISLAISASFNLNDGSPPVPSEKARGKRRADLPPPASPAYARTRPHGCSQNEMSAVTANRFFSSPGHPDMQYRDVLPPGFRGNQATDVMLSSLLTMTSPQDSLLYGSQIAHGQTESVVSDYHSLFPGDNPPTSLDSSLTALEDLWPESDHLGMDMDPLNEPQYRPETINPQLLQPAYEFDGSTSRPDEADDLGKEGGAWDMTYPGREKDASSPPASSASGPKSSEPLTQVTKETRPENVVSGPSRHQAASPSVLLEEPDPFADIPPYRSDSEDGNWEGRDVELGRGKRKKRKTTRFEIDHYDSYSRNEMSDGYLDSGAARFAAEEKKRAATTRKTGPPKSATKLAIGPPQNSKVWEKGKVEEYCHQCRTRSARLKMSCAKCPIKFCNRCMSLRYPDIEFSSAFPTARPCPRCCNTCNCTACCAKRGEEYFSTARRQQELGLVPPASSQGTPKPRPKTKANVQASSSRPTSQVIRTSIIVEPSSDFMGPFYALDGSKMQVQVATIDDGEDYIPDVVYQEANAMNAFGDVGGSPADALFEVGEQPVGPPLLEPFKPRRVFIGRVQPSWGFGPESRIGFLENPDVDEVVVPENVDFQQVGRKVRWYAGRKPRPPPPPVPVSATEDQDDEEDEGNERDGRGDDGGMLAFDGFGDWFSSPLTSLPDSELPCVEDLDGDEGNGRFVESLDDDDLVRLLIALNAAIPGASTEQNTPIGPNFNP